MTSPCLKIEELGVIRLKSISVYKVLHNILEKSFSLELQNQQVGKSNTVFPHIVSAETILFWICKPKDYSK